MEIYVVTKSEYSDYSIVGVTTNYEDAHLYVESLNQKYPPSFEGDEYRVEIFIDGKMSR